MQTMNIRITTVTDNVAANPECRTEWGFAAVAEVGEMKLLFDTGASGDALMHNMETLGFSPDDIGAIVISHDHWDHTGGLDAFLSARRTVEGLPLYLPAGFDSAPIATHPVRAVESERWERIAPGVLSTGTLGADHIPEQALVVQTSDGVSIVTGCAHPGISEIVETVVDYCGEPLRLVVGGFHLFRSGPDERERVLNRLDDFDIRRLSPSHCTGEEGIAEIAATFPETCVPGGAGTVYEAEVS